MLLFIVFQHVLASRRNATFLPKVGEMGVGEQGHYRGRDQRRSDMKEETVDVFLAITVTPAHCYQ